MACCGSGGKKSGGKSAAKSTGSRPLSYTKKLNMPSYGTPKVKGGALKFGSRK